MASIRADGRRFGDGRRCRYERMGGEGAVPARGETTEEASMAMVAIRWGRGGVDGSGVVETASMSMVIRLDGGGGRSNGRGIPSSSRRRGRTVAGAGAWGKKEVEAVRRPQRRMRRGSRCGGRGVEWCGGRGSRLFFSAMLQL
jgi:hypothetical protein